MQHHGLMNMTSISRQVYIRNPISLSLCVLYVLNRSFFDVDALGRVERVVLSHGECRGVERGL